MVYFIPIKGMNYTLTFNLIKFFINNLYKLTFVKYIMNKRGKGKFWFVFAIILFLALGVIAQDDIKGKISDLSNETEKFIKGFVQENNDIKENDISSINKVDLANPPEDVKIGNIDEDTGIAIYQMNYTQDNQDKKLYVVTYSTGQFKAPIEFKPVNAIEYLNFGEKDLKNDSTYLQTATGVETSSDKGYVMIDSGSITGISSSIEITKADADGKIEIVSTPNQDSPLSEKKTPIMGIDVWEHAYYLKYKNRRADYIAAFWNVLDWERINKNFLAIREK